MPAVKVVTDSACDIPSSLAERLAIEVVPLTIRFGDEEFTDRKDLTPSEFWIRCNKSDTLPETAAPSPGAFHKVFQRAAAEGYEGIVCVTLSSALSATYQAAMSAADSLRGRIPVELVDSCSVSMGEGLQAVVAAEVAGGGRSLDEVAATARSLVPRTKAFGALADLEALKKGGRIGGARAFVGSLLSIKPIIEVRAGVVEAESRQRTRARSLEYLVAKVKQASPVERLAVMHGDAGDVRSFVRMLGEVFPEEDMIVADIGPVIGAHTGPGTIGVTYLVAG